MQTALAYGRLLRLSLAPSALADVAAGVVLGLGLWPGGSAPWLLMLSSACVYHGAMALNDWADREHDARTRADRPIPSGAVPASAALALGVLLPVLGVTAAGIVDWRLGGWAAGLAVLASLYDVAGRGALLGPLLLAGCRAGNMGLGLALAWVRGEPAPWTWFALPLIYGLYVFVVSRLGRFEDGEQEGQLDVAAPRLLKTIAACLLALPLSAAILKARAEAPASHYIGVALALVLALSAAKGLWQAAREQGEWSLGRVGRSMGLSLRRLLILSACASLVRFHPQQWDGAVVATLILLGFPLAVALRRVFPPS